MCGCYDKCMGVLVIYVPVFTVLCIVCSVFFYWLIYIYIVYIYLLILIFFCICVRTTATK
jgi:hypothetical protein